MKRILAMSCDAKFFVHAQDLVSSVHDTSAGVVDEILFFDLGIDAQQRAALEAMSIRVLSYPQSLIDNTYPDFLAPRIFAWKTYAIQEALSHGDLILYCDCACVAMNSLQPIFDAIEADDIFLIQDPHITGDRTHAACLGIMQANAAEREARFIDAGVMGVRAAGRFAHLFREAFEFSKIRECIAGDDVMHRHDQSIYSVLATRHNAPKHSDYGSFVHWKGLETVDQIIWQHRGKWPAFQRLAKRSIQQPQSRVAIYGTGRHTERFLNTFRVLLEPRHRIVGFLDDQSRGDAYGGLPLMQTEAWRTLNPDIILISSDAYEEAMHAKIAALASPPSSPNPLDIWRIYG